MTSSEASPPEAPDYVDSWVNSFAPVTEIINAPDEQEDWIVKYLLRPGTYMIVYGREGRGKSRILYQLGAAIADGGTWFGCAVEDRGNVVFLQADMAPKESKAIIKAASKMNLLRDNIFFPTTFGILDVLTPEGQDVLLGIKERLDPKVLIIDTATDVYEPKMRHKDDTVNAPVRECVRTFRAIFPDAGLIFVLHERKSSQFLQAKGVEDEDSALGGGEWTRKAASVVRLKGLNDVHAELQIRKTRDRKPYAKLKIRRNSFGFFEPEVEDLDALQALVIWPGIASLVVPDRVNVSSVARSIEEASGGRLKAESVRRAYQRAKDSETEFGWERMLENAPQGV